MTQEIVRIATPMPAGPGAVNAYLVPLDGGGYMLVDGGVNTEDAWRILDQEITSRVDWSEVRLHFATHMHQDHIGLNFRVREACGAPLLMGELDATRMAHAAAEPEEESHYREALLRRSGVPEEVLQRAISFAAGGQPVPFIAADLKLAPADIVLNEAPEWRAIWTPGHTAGHTVLYRERDKLLISGDAVLPQIEPTIGVNRQRQDPIADHLSSLDGLRGLDMAEVLPGHGLPLRGADRIAASRAALERESERIGGAVGGGETAWEINLRVHSRRKLRTGALLHELRGTVAHLEHHLLLGTLKAETNRGVRLFYT